MEDLGTDEMDLWRRFILEDEQKPSAHSSWSCDAAHENASGDETGDPFSSSVPDDAVAWFLELLDRTARFESEAAALMVAWQRFDETIDDIGPVVSPELIPSLVIDPWQGRLDNSSCRACGRARARSRTRPTRP